MLTSLKIKNFVLISDTILKFKPGLTVITGETGAGKSIILDALEICLGSRADKKKIKHGADNLDITAEFNINSHSAIKEILLDNSLIDNLIEDICVIRRLVYQEKPSKIFINGNLTNISTLKKLANLLAQVYLQHAYHFLLNKENQLAVLDLYAGHESDVKKLKQIVNNYQDINYQIDLLEKNNQSSIQRKDLLNFQLKELDRFQNYTSNDIKKMKQEHESLTYAKDNLARVCQALLLLENSNENSFSLNSSFYQLGKIFGDIKDKSEIHQNIITRIVSLTEEVKDLKWELEKYADKFNVDPAYYADLDEKITLLFGFAKKYPVEMEEIPNLYKSIQQELENLDGFNDKLIKLKAELNVLKQQYNEISQKISNKRKKTAVDLVTQIQLAIDKLKMTGVEFNIIINDKIGLNFFGNETIDFQISTNKGKFGLLQDIASGGELSRISLAIQVALMNKCSFNTIVFDEVDVGIGGAVSEIVGEFLSKLSRKSQVICITHQAQVAGKADTHLLIKKDFDLATVKVNILDISSVYGLKVSEIARMIGGIKINQTVIEHAKTILNDN